MTVIAWDGEVLAADRQTTHTSGIRRLLCKAWKTEHKTMGPILFATCGSAMEGEMVREWLRGGPKPENLVDMNAIVINRKGHVFELGERLVFLRLHNRKHALGSGAKVALAVMEMKGSAIKAVEVANKLIEGCGGGVDVVRF